MRRSTGLFTNIMLKAFFLIIFLTALIGQPLTDLAEADANKAVVVARYEGPLSP